MNLKNLFFAFILLGLTFACSKTDTTVAAKTNKELLAGTSTKSWKALTAQAVSGNLTIDLFSLPTFNQPCLLDNILVLKSDNTFQITEGATKCNATDPNVVLSSNWSLSTDQKTLHVDRFVIAGLEKDNLDFTIIELTDTSMKAKTTLTIQGTTYDVTMTFAVSA